MKTGESFTVCRVRTVLHADLSVGLGEADLPLLAQKG